MSKRIQKKILFILGIISLIVSLIFLAKLNTMKGHYHSMFLLPLFYGLSLILISISNSLNLFKTLAMGSYSVKLLITPLFLTTIGNREIETGLSQSVYTHIPDAVLLQVIEIIAVSFFLFVLPERKVFQSKSFTVPPHKKTWTILKLICLLSVALVIVYPQFLYKFQPILFRDQDAYIAQRDLSLTVKESMNVYIYNVGLWLIPLSKLIVVYILIFILCKVSKGGNMLTLILSLLVVLISCLFTSSDRAATIYTGIAGLFLIHKIYDKYRKLINRYSVVFAVGGIFYIFLYNSIFKADDAVSEVGYKLNAYFAGTLNVAACFEMNDSNLLETFVGDILRNIPFAMGFFVHLPMSYLEFNRALGYDEVYNSQIIPVIGQGFYYLHIIGVILFPILMFKVAYYFYNHIEHARDSFEYFAYMIALIYTFLGVNLYDMFLTMGLVLQYGLPMFVISSYSYFVSKKTSA